MIEQLSIDLSNYCSKGCHFCYNRSHARGDVMWHPQEVTSFAKDCIVNGMKAISLGGGEPLEYEGVFEVVEALFPLCYLTITSNGLPLERSEVWQKLQQHKPDKMHLTIHFPDDAKEVHRVRRQVKMLAHLGIKPGVNLLVSSNKVEAARRAYAFLRAVLHPSQIILVPQRYANTPSPEQLARVSHGEYFQSPSCLLACECPKGFASVSWDKRANVCSFAGGKVSLPSLDYAGLLAALSQVHFRSCLPH